ncbi:hypothetical protein N9M34_00565 [Aquiluna sp.]|nr:hypothetical protein [Aquiluna sp.]
MPVLPNAGGLDIQDDQAANLMPVEHRNVIAVKGYQGWAGEAKVALKALLKISDALANLEVVVFSASYATRRLAKSLNRKTCLTIECNPKNSLSHSEVQNIFSRSLIYVGISKTDGISTSLLEAMSQGAIPVQSGTSCANEWLEGAGVIVKGFEVEEVASSILTAIELAKNPRNAVQNVQIVLQKASSSHIHAMVGNYYDLIAQGGRQSTERGT